MMNVCQTHCETIKVTTGVDQTKEVQLEAQYFTQRSDDVRIESTSSDISFIRRVGRDDHHARERQDAKYNPVDVHLARSRSYRTAKGTHRRICLEY